jgi:ribonuclease G
LTDAVNPLIEEEIFSPKKLLNKILNRTEKQAPKVKAKPLTLKAGQEILVQVVKDPFSTKGARLTTHISLAGRFVVYMPCDNNNGVSKRIDNQQERQRLKEVLKDFKFAKNGGFIVRTASLGQDKQGLIRDAKFLYKMWHQITKVSDRKKAPALIYKEYDLVWKVVRDYLTDKVDKLVIDSYDDSLKVKKFVQNLIGKEQVNKVHHYKGATHLFEHKGVSKELAKIYNSKVHLKSGAYIVIEPTEGLIVVDVNSGKFKTKASPEEAACMVNIESAHEIARQLRLRDLGGIIVIDFIDMSKESNKRKVLHALQEALTHDHAKAEVNRISALGLVEMTRARTGKTLESKAFEPCPYCHGRGKIKTD